MVLLCVCGLSWVNCPPQCVCSPSWVNGPPQYVCGPLCVDGLSKCVCGILYCLSFCLICFCIMLCLTVCPFYIGILFLKQCEKYKVQNPSRDTLVDIENFNVNMYLYFSIQLSYWIKCLISLYNMGRIYSIDIHCAWKTPQFCYTKSNPCYRSES
jgi:hypothetical protein